MAGARPNGRAVLLCGLGQLLDEEGREIGEIAAEPQLLGGFPPRLLFARTERDAKTVVLMLEPLFFAVTFSLEGRLVELLRARAGGAGLRFAPPVRP